MNETKHISSIDVAKGIGICLVFYGHYIESFFKPIPAGGMTSFALAMNLQWQFIYSFHIPLFFFLAGIVHRPWHGTPLELLRRQLTRRYGPIVFYNIFGVLLYVAGNVYFDQSFAESLKNHSAAFALSLVKGTPPHPLGVTWFLICLSTLEILGYLIDRGLDLFRANPRRGWIAGALACAALGYALKKTGVHNFHFFMTALVCVPLLAAGKLLPLSRIEEFSKRQLVLCIVAALIALIAAFAANCVDTPPESGLQAMGRAVTLSGNNTGNPFFFYVTAGCGSMVCLGLAVLLRKSRLLAHIGRHSLHLFCLNGFFLVFFNLPLAYAVGRLAPRAGTHPAVATLSALLITGIQAGLCCLALRVVEPVYGKFTDLWSFLCFKATLGRHYKKRPA